MKPSTLSLHGPACPKLPEVCASTMLIVTYVKNCTPKKVTVQPDEEMIR
jgi:hypothetical protein